MGLRELGVEIKEEYGELNCKACSLKGTHINLSFPSVGATENIMIAAALGEGETVISNAAREPEIIDLANFLNKCGANIHIKNGGVVVIKGVSELSGADHTIMPDRILSASYMCAAAATGGELYIENALKDHLSAVIPFFEQAGCSVFCYDNGVYIRGKNKLKSVSTVRTMPYPGFPTDAQPQLMAMLCKAEGTTVFVETIFENRFRHTCELNKMGANIRSEGRVAVVDGVKTLYGAKVRATDLRAGAAMIIAALSAEGISEISDIYHIDRGYEKIENALQSLGAKIKRENRYE
jgi:UDP-N-acetylglucosamine 1-carboxyvinyltransferase